MPKDKYQQRMSKKQAHINERIKQANIDKNLVVLLTGNGKGKSSSALGMVCRALGYDMNIAIVKFLKGEQLSGEDTFLKSQKNIQTAYMKTGFTWDTQDREYDTKKAQETWAKAKNFLNDKSINLVVLDELTYMLNYKYLNEKQVIATIQNRPINQHLVITGRSASDKLKTIANTVSIIKDEKHAFRDNIKAQKGIDY